MPQQAEDRVRVRAPDGVTGTIPRSGLAEAEAEGYTLINEQAQAAGPTGKGALRRLGEGFYETSPLSLAELPKAIGEKTKQLGPAFGPILGGPAVVAEGIGRMGQKYVESLRDPVRYSPFPKPVEAAVRLIGDPAIRRFTEGDIAGGIGAAGGILTSLFTPTKKVGGVPIAGGIIPATKGMLRPGGAASIAENVLEEIPIIGRSISNVKTKLAPEGAAATIGRIASRETSGAVAARGATSAVEDVTAAGRSFHQKAGRIYDVVEREAGPLGEEFRRLQGQRQEIQVARTRKNTGQEARNLKQELAGVEAELDSLFDLVGNPELRGLFNDANALATRGFAIDKFAKTFRRASKRFSGEAQEKTGLLPREQEYVSGSLVRQVKEMAVVERGKKLSELEVAFGKQGAQDVIKTVELLDRARIDTSWAARFRVMAKQGAYIGAAGVGFYASPGVTGGVLGGGWLLSRALANQPGRLAIRNWLAASPKSRAAAYWAGQIGRAAQEEQQQ
jgi:hypothetical protein